MSVPELRKIKGWPGYYVTQEGRVVSTHRWPPIELEPHYHQRTGHMRVSLWRCGFRRHHYVHTLVAQAFIGERPSPEHEVLHNDGDPWNNSVSNLRYGTTRENAQDRERHRRQRLGLVDELDEDGLPPYVPDAVLGF